MNRVVGIAVVACALAGVATPVCAQTIGLKLGLTASKLEFDPDEGDQDRMTPQPLTDRRAGLVHDLVMVSMQSGRLRRF